MKMYQTPNISVLDASECMLATTQSAGSSGQSAVNAACAFTGCQEPPSVGNDAADFIVSWEDSDNDASDAGNYIVTVDINGDTFIITDATQNCNFTFGPTFQVTCLDVDAGDSCIVQQLNTLTVVSIEDPQGNVFSPSGEDCQFQNEQG
jgi:hypothetical protein